MVLSNICTGKRMQLDSAEGTELAEYLPVSAANKTKDNERTRQPHTGE